ncbi:unnamed protein product [Mesocestoides corti]|uniref:Fanconi anemia group M protein n=1 Tax=Mesocestoides corti TaxID=53468 RepID=A0A0R3UMP2_MESCO|nr:unnamed protein product [Mesocestoides corti]
MDALFAGVGNLKLDASSLLDAEPELVEGEVKNHVSETFPDFPNRPPINYVSTANDSENLPGFDLSAGKEWYYPTGAELRTYQFVITERCLYQNCLVCIPTGLGKTFIAAVVLYNFLRWYPTGRVVFMAPTRPLVSQQMLACREFTGLSSSGDAQAGGMSAVELTGSISPQQRAALWAGPHRAFFLTPQVIANDLAASICPAKSIRCIVIDEAHKATGNHAYCQVVRAITGPPYNHRQFRILALSATPASDLAGAQAVIANLLISHIEVRTEDSEDVREFCHQRDIETIVVRLDPQLAVFKQRLCDLARPPLQRLCERRALWYRGNPDRLDPEAFAEFTLVKARETFAQENRFSPLAGAVHRDFRIATCVARAIQLLVQYGLRPVYQFLLTSIESSGDLAQVSGMREFVSDLGNVLGAPEGAAVMSQLPFVAGHPKLCKLRDVLLEHFEKASAAVLSQRGTRAIVFTQFRDSVSDIMHMLKTHSPLLRPAVFVGQSSGHQPSAAASGMPARVASRKRNTQRDQLQVMRDFREGRVNILISTCIGEEGVDVGQVDLIVCFDAHKSPARLIQRLGRTGRRRAGRVVVLLTEGREQSNFALSVARSNTVSHALLQGQSGRQLTLYPHNPRMVPLGVSPLPVHWHPQTTTTAASALAADKLRINCGVDPLRRSIIDNWTTNNLSCREFRCSPCEIPSLLSVGGGCGNDLDTVTRRYSANRYIPSIRDEFQGGAFGPSSATWHLVSSLRLIEMHRRGRTHAMYHALGLRSLDMSRPLSEILPPSSSQSTQALCPTGTASEVTLACAVPNIPKPSREHPPVRFFRGLVSKTLMVDPRVDITNDLSFPPVLPTDDITLEGLNKAFTEMVKSELSSRDDGVNKNRFQIPGSGRCRSVLEKSSVVFDSAFGLPAPLPPTLPRSSPLSTLPPAKRPRTVNGDDDDSEVVSSAKTTSRNLLFDSKLQISDKFDDFLNPR